MKKEDYQYVEQSLLNVMKGLDDKTVTHGEAKSKAMVGNALFKGWNTAIRYSEMMGNPDSKDAYETFTKE